MEAIIDEANKQGLGTMTHLEQTVVTNEYIPDMARWGLSSIGTVFQRLYLRIRRYKIFQLAMIIIMNMIVSVKQGNFGHKRQIQEVRSGLRLSERQQWMKQSYLRKRIMSQLKLGKFAQVRSEERRVGKDGT